MFLVCLNALLVKLSSATTKTCKRMFSVLCRCCAPQFTARGHANCLTTPFSFVKCNVCVFVVFVVQNKCLFFISVVFVYSVYYTGCLQCFDAVGWVAGRASGLWKTESWGAGVVVCLERGADLHMAQRMPVPLTVSRFSKIQIGFTFLVAADLGSPGQRAVKRVCVCVCIVPNHKTLQNV